MAPLLVLFPMVAYPFPSAPPEALVDCSTKRLRRLSPISTPKDDTSLWDVICVDVQNIATEQVGPDVPTLTWAVMIDPFLGYYLLDLQMDLLTI